MKNKFVKSFYFSTLNSSDEDVEILEKYNPAKSKAYNLAKKIDGIVKIRYFPEDEGREYRVYKRKK